MRPVVCYKLFWKAIPMNLWTLELAEGGLKNFKRNAFVAKRSGLPRLNVRNAYRLIGGRDWNYPPL